MKITAAIPLALAATLGLAACTPAAQNETAEAVDTVAADANATTTEAIEDTDAATAQTLGEGESRLDNAAAVIGNGIDRAKDKTGKAMEDLGNDIQD